MPLKELIMKKPIPSLAVTEWALDELDALRIDREYDSR